MKAMGVGVGACKWREIEVARAELGRARRCASTAAPSGWPTSAASASGGSR